MTVSTERSILVPCWNLVSHLNRYDWSKQQWPKCNAQSGPSLTCRSQYLPHVGWGKATHLLTSSLYSLWKFILDSGIQIRGTIFLKTVQVLEYADDIDLMACTTLGFNEAFLNLEKSARNKGLVINQEKTVYMYSGKDTALHQDLAIGNYVFKRVDNLKYLGTMVNKMNNRSVEVNARLIMANRAYYG